MVHGMLAIASAARRPGSLSELPSAAYPEALWAARGSDRLGILDEFRNRIAIAAARHTHRARIRAKLTQALYVQYGCGLSAPDDWLNFDASPTLWLQLIPV